MLICVTLLEKVTPKMKTINSIILIIVTISLYPATAFSHKVNIFAYAREGQIFAEGYFADGHGAGDSFIDVFNANTEQWLLKRSTDSNGKASFKIPEITSLKLVISTTTGHRSEYTISEEEIKSAMDRTKAELHNHGRHHDHDIQKDEPLSKTAPVPGISHSELESIMEKVTDKKLQPIKNILLKIEKKQSEPGVTEIVGGIGYILGLLGIFAYYKSRK